MIIALIDNDVVQKLAEIKRNTQDEKEEVIRQVFHSLNIQARMHELVHLYEFRDLNNAKEFFDHGLFSVLSFAEIFEGKAEKEAYYRILVPELYKKQSGEELRIGDVMNGWLHCKSLGEVHSLAACMVGGYAMFISDDRDSKSLSQIIKRDYRKTIPVYNRDELIRQLNPETVKKTNRNAFRHTH